MTSNASSEQTVGVIGAGSFGTAFANLLAENKSVILYARRQEVIDQLEKTRLFKGYPINPNIRFTNSLEELASTCNVIFPVIPSEGFPSMLEALSPFLKPYHIIIHGTKGLHVDLPPEVKLSEVSELHREEVKSMSELIRDKTVVLRVGCVAGPNLAGEIAEGQPAAAVVASYFDEVIREGQLALRSSRFRVHGNHDLIGIELAGVLKNIMAIAAGIIHGLGYGENTRALLITRGMAEMIHIGKSLGADPRAFLGLGGIGDLIATCSSRRSRNFTVGYRLAQGETLSQILESMEEVAEGVRTVCIIKAIATRHKLAIPITNTLHRTMFHDMDIARGVRILMEFPFSEDVEFI